MKRKRRAFTEQFKAVVALEALKEVKTLSELATEYKVHPNQISAWKKQLLNHVPNIFESGKAKAGKSEEELTAPLYEEIGRLKMDIKWLKKKLGAIPGLMRRNWVERNKKYSIRRQCDLAGVSRSTFYHAPVVESEKNLRIMRLIDEQYLLNPEYGSPRMTDWLRDNGWKVNHKRVERLMRVMGIQAITPGPHTSTPCPGHKIYPYLLRDLEITRVNQVWGTDITYIPMKSGFLYLAAVIDWFSRYVLAWELSNTLESSFCINALNSALRTGTPDIFNSDQGSQFTSEEFTSVLLGRKIQISMDGRGRALDNVFTERLWWSVKYENVYPNCYSTGRALAYGLKNYFGYYNDERKHSSLGKKTPAEIYYAGI
ncbi:MAG: IS3 family transposase [Kiritimatiellia bacterium]